MSTGVSPRHRSVAKVATHIYEHYARPIHHVRWKGVVGVQVRGCTCHSGQGHANQELYTDLPSAVPWALHVRLQLASSRTHLPDQHGSPRNDVATLCNRPQQAELNSSRPIRGGNSLTSMIKPLVIRILNDLLGPCGSDDNEDRYGYEGDHEEHEKRAAHLCSHDELVQPFYGSAHAANLIRGESLPFGVRSLKSGLEDVGEADKGEGVQHVDKVFLKVLFEKVPYAPLHEILDVRDPPQHHEGPPLKDPFCDRVPTCRRTEDHQEHDRNHTAVVKKHVTLADYVAQDEDHHAIKGIAEETAKLE